MYKNVDISLFIQNFHVKVKMSEGIRNILPKDIKYWKLPTFSGLKLITLIFKYPKNLQKAREIWLTVSSPCLERVVFFPPKLSLSADLGCLAGRDKSYL